MIYTKGDFVFVFNFHPERSFEGYFVPVGEAGEYKVVLSSDEEKYGGFSRVNMEQKYEAKETPDGWFGFQCYLPSRSAIVLKKEPKKVVKKKVVIKKIFKK